ncbi:unnamed protein product, partial [Prorocentrum cordatum]
TSSAPARPWRETRRPRSCARPGRLRSEAAWARRGCARRRRRRRPPRTRRPRSARGCARARRAWPRRRARARSCGPAWTSEAPTGRSSRGTARRCSRNWMRWSSGGGMRRSARSTRGRGRSSTASLTRSTPRGARPCCRRSPSRGPSTRRGGCSPTTWTRRTGSSWTRPPGRHARSSLGVFTMALSDARAKAASAAAAKLALEDQCAALAAEVQRGTQELAAQRGHAQARCSEEVVGQLVAARAELEAASRRASRAADEARRAEDAAAEAALAAGDQERLLRGKLEQLWGAVRQCGAVGAAGV